MKYRSHTSKFHLTISTVNAYKLLADAAFFGETDYSYIAYSNEQTNMKGTYMHANNVYKHHKSH